MNINDSFTFGQYKNLTLLEVFSGTKKINTTLLKKYLSKSLNESKIEKPNEFQFILELVIMEDEITIFPDNTFDENKPPGVNNLFYLGNMSKKLENFFNNFFKTSWVGIIETLEKFNDKNVLGANPEYIDWCISKNYIKLSQETKKELEKKEINRLLGIKVKEKSTNKYSYKPYFQTEYYIFKN